MALRWRRYVKKPIQHHPIDSDSTKLNSTYIGTSYRVHCSDSLVSHQSIRSICYILHHLCFSILDYICFVVNSYFAEMLSGKIKHRIPAWRSTFRGSFRVHFCVRRRQLCTIPTTGWPRWVQTPTVSHQPWPTTSTIVGCVELKSIGRCEIGFTYLNDEPACLYTAEDGL